MNREQFFQELRTALHREGFTPQPEQDELLPVEWDGLPLCRITADGGVRYWQEAQDRYAAAALIQPFLLFQSGFRENAAAVRG